MGIFDKVEITEDPQEKAERLEKELIEVLKKRAKEQGIEKELEEMKDIVVKELKGLLRDPAAYFLAAKRLGIDTQLPIKPTPNELLDKLIEECE